MIDSSTISWVLGAISMGGAALWTVAAIRGTTRELRMSIEHLAACVGKLSGAIDDVKNRQVDHEVRLALLERSRDE